MCALVQFLTPSKNMSNRILSSYLQVGLSAAYLGLPIVLPGASGPAGGGPVESLALPAQSASSAQGTSSSSSSSAAASRPPLPQPIVVSGSPVLAGGSPAMPPSACGNGDASSPGEVASPSAAAHAVWQQVLGPVTGPEFSSLAAQILEAFKWNEGDPATAPPYANALEARLKALGVLSASAAHPGPGVKSEKSATKRPRPPPPPPPPTSSASSAPPPPSSSSSSPGSAPPQPRRAPPPPSPPPPSGESDSDSKRTKF